MLVYIHIYASAPEDLLGLVDICQIPVPRFREHIHIDVYTYFYIYSLSRHYLRGLHTYLYTYMYVQ